MYLDDFNIYICEESRTLFDLNNLKIFKLSSQSYKQVTNGNYGFVYRYYLKNNHINLKNDNDINIQCIKINISQICNLNCSYCYASEGEYNARGIMNKQVMKRLADVISKCFNDVETISFFGGEPTLNCEAIEYFCRKFPNKNYLMQTNGILLNSKKIQDLIKKYDITVTLSVDGNREMHDKYRRTKDNQPTYDIIKNNLDDLKNNGIRISAAQVTYTNTKYSKKVLAENIYHDLGIKDIHIENLCNSDLISKGIETKKVKALSILDELKDLEINKNYVMAQNVKRILMPLLTKEKGNNLFCEASQNVLSVDINGNLWPCHLTVGDGKEICNIIYCNYDEIINAVRMRASELHKKNKVTEVQCQKCIARYHCIKCLKYKNDVNYYKNICKNKQENTVVVLEWFGKHLDYIDKFRVLFGG